METMVIFGLVLAYIVGFACGESRQYHEYQGRIAALGREIDKLEADISALEHARTPEAAQGREQWRELAQWPTEIEI